MVVILGEDLVRDVLERLPVKSLMRFKCVQQSWNALFKTHSFVSKHRHMQQGLNERVMIVRIEDYVGSQKFLITLLLCNEPPHLQVQNLQYPFPYPSADESLAHIQPYGHFNGVFCLDGNFGNEWICQTIMWNPATREVKVVPQPPNKPSSDKSFVLSGFGADPNTLNDFKYVKLYFIFDNEIRLLHLLAEVYNLSTNSWTIIHVGVDDIFYPSTALNVLQPFLQNGALANGVYHWLSRDGTYILCFDFRYNQFRKLKTPPTAIRGTFVEADDDSIAYAVYHYVDEHFRVEIWILKQDSWTKKYNIEPLEWSIEIFAILKDGAEFLGGSKYISLASYNSDAQPVRQFQIYPSNYCFCFPNYVESITPLSI